MALIELIRSEDAKGCGPACLAMVLGITYAEAKRRFHDRFWGDDHSFHNDGIDPILLDVLLADDGYAILRKWKNERDRNWCKPFAPLHLVTFAYPNGGHFAVMTYDGLVMDPARPGPRLLESDTFVQNVAGLYRVLP